MTKLRELSSDLKRKYKYECSNRNCGMIFRYPHAVGLKCPNCGSSINLGEIMEAKLMTGPYDERSIGD